MSKNFNSQCIDSASPFAGSLFLLLIFCLALSSPILGNPPQSGPDTVMVNAPRSVRASRIGDEVIDIDGRLNESIWSRLPKTSGLIQREPDEGARASRKTDIMFAYSNEYLYVGARMFSKGTEAIQTTLSRRDNSASSERIIISLDTYLDRRTAYSFALTASGVRLDYYHPQDEMFERDYSYDPVWTGDANIDSVGWTAEFRIPFSQLRFNEKKELVWGININRYIPTLNEDDFWVLIPQDETGWASRFGLLRGIKNIEPKHRLEFLPYFAGEATINDEVNQENPFSERVEKDARIGGDIKFGLGSNLTLDATVNPDFGQVEADPAEVNLSAFETFFDEKRPFFTEGSQLLQSSGANYFYSRRIGAAPSYRPDDDYVDMASNTPILGAAKLTGRMPSGLSVGALTAVTARESARVYDIQTDTYSDERVEPVTSYNVARLQQEFGPNSSTAGIILTGVERRMNRGETLNEQLARRAYTGGADWNWRFAGAKYKLSGDAGFSYISGSQGAIARIQRSSTHYFQRPDAAYLSLDSTRTSLSGYRAFVEFGKREGAHWLWSVWAGAESPEYELNDIGILFHADQYFEGVWLTYRENQPGSWYQSYSMEGHNENVWNYGNVLRHSEVELEFDLEWLNFWHTFADLGYEPRTQDDRLTRGGPLMGSPTEWSYRLGMENGHGARTRWRIDMDYNHNEFDGWEYQVDTYLESRAGGNWEFSVSPEYSRRRDTRQYLTTLDNGPAATYGKRYIFSHIDRSTLSVQFRVNYAFATGLTLEMYAEPFASSGNYFRPGELPEPRSFELREYGTGHTTVDRTAGGDYLIHADGQQFTVEDPDFLVYSFRSNLVLRWQWRPGSTFYLVWQQNRFSRINTDRWVHADDLTRSLNRSGDNFLALKFSYWIPANF